jgi:hypothetical protein
MSPVLRPPPGVMTPLSNTRTASARSRMSRV